MPSLPPDLYLVAELLNQNIIKSSKFKGFQINNTTRVKVIAFADDNAIPITTTRCAKNFLKILESYEKATASKANKLKKEFLSCKRDGKVAKFFQKKGYNIKKPNTQTRYLGIQIGTNPNYNVTWDWLKRSIEITLRQWHRICSTIYGRALILKSKGLSKLWYVASILPLTPYALACIKEIQKECTNFFWAYKGHKLRYANLMKTTEKGGFKLWNLKDKIISLQVKWVAKFENPQCKALWKLNMAQILNNTQQRLKLNLPLTHSTQNWSHDIPSPLVANFLSSWSGVLDRSPLHLDKGDWVASY